MTPHQLADEMRTRSDWRLPGWQPRQHSKVNRSTRRWLVLLPTGPANSHKGRGKPPRLLDKWVSDRLDRHGYKDLETAREMLPTVGVHVDLLTGDVTYHRSDDDGHHWSEIDAI